MKKILSLLIIGFLATSCFKEDKFIGRQLVKEEVGRVDMVAEDGVDYPRQIYFDLSTTQARAFNYRDSWDLAFGCQPENPNISTNPSLLMQVAATGSSEWGKNFNTADYKFSYERADRFLHEAHLAADFEGTVPKGEVFILDMGRSLKNQARGYKLLQITSYDGKAYQVRVAKLDHSSELSFTVPLDETYNFVYLSLSDPDQVMKLEPPKEEWDLWFTKYMERLYDGSDTLDYSVTGCLINPYRTSVALYTDSLPFEQVTLQNADLSLLSGLSSGIGHDWKFYDLEEGYKVLDKRVYLVQDPAGVNYKMSFTGFHDEASRKGAVTFKFIPL